MRYYSTTAKYKGFTELLMTIVPMNIYPNEKVERTVKMICPRFHGQFKRLI